jgi:hypothetical protein
LDKDRLSRIPKNIRQWYERKPQGWFGLSRDQHNTKLEQLARYAQKLIVLFKSDKEVASSEQYELLVGLFQEQCEIKGNNKKIKVRNKTKGATLQSAFDPEASYGHKGKGAIAHITETCNNPKKTEIITDYEVHGAARSDMGKLRVLRATKVRFAVACKVIACNIKRWGKALSARASALQRLIWFAFRRSAALDAIVVFTSKQGMVAEAAVTIISNATSSSR